MRFVWARTHTPFDASRIIAAVAAECEEHDVDPALVVAVIWQESRFDAAARGAAGEVGLMQLLPSTFGGWGRYDYVEGNIACGVAYLAGELRAYGTERAGLAHYNGGPRPGRRSWAYADEVLRIRREDVPAGPTR